MTDIYLVRHGQASFGKANYDKLSELGGQQAIWLGDYFKHRNVEFDAVFSGDMVRHHETKDGIASGIATEDYTLPEVTVNSALNEFNFQAVATAYLTRYPEAKVPEGASPSEYYRLLKKAMLSLTDCCFDNGLPNATRLSTRSQAISSARCAQPIRRIQW